MPWVVPYHRGGMVWHGLGVAWALPYHGMGWGGYVPHWDNRLCVCDSIWAWCRTAHGMGVFDMPYALRGGLCVNTTLVVLFRPQFFREVLLFGITTKQPRPFSSDFGPSTRLLHPNNLPPQSCGTTTRPEHRVVTPKQPTKIRATFYDPKTHLGCLHQQPTSISGLFTGFCRLDRGPGRLNRLFWTFRRFLAF